MRMLVTAPSDRSSDYTGMARQALAECPELKELVFLPDGGQPQLQAGDPETDAELTYAELLKRADDVGHSVLKARLAGLDPDDPINLQYTSGTTGLPQRRHAHPPQHPEQRLFHRRAAGLHGT